MAGRAGCMFAGCQPASQFSCLTWVVRHLSQLLCHALAIGDGVYGGALGPCWARPAEAMPVGVHGGDVVWVHFDDQSARHCLVGGLRGTAWGRAGRWCRQERDGSVLV